MSTASRVASVLDELRSHADAARAAKERAYLKSDLEFFGAGMPTVRRIAKPVARELKIAGRKAVVDTAKALWRHRIHEARSTAVAILEATQSLLEPGDFAVLEQFVRESRTWALVDWLAVHVIGPLVARNAALSKEIDRFAVDPDFWVRRTALLSCVSEIRAGRSGLVRFEKLATPMFGEREFFIRKAIGWVLREAATDRPDEVRAFVKRHGAKMAPLSLREATRKLEVPKASRAASATARGRARDR